MTSLRLKCGLVAVALALGACGGGGGGPEGATSTTAPRRTTSSTATAPSTTALSAEGLRLEPGGLGPVRVGMTLAEAEDVLGRPLEPVTAPTDECTLFAPAGGFDGIAFLVTDGTVARADVTAGATATAEGMALGQTETEAQRRYGGRLVVTPHDFLLGGNYLTLVPTGADASFRLVAETDGDRITAMRAGRLPEVELTEGCA